MTQRMRDRVERVALSVDKKVSKWMHSIRFDAWRLHALEKDDLIP